LLIGLHWENFIKIDSIVDILKADKLVKLAEPGIMFYSTCHTRA